MKKEKYAWIALFALAFVLSVMFSPCILAGEQGSGYIKNTQELINFEMSEGLAGGFESHEWDDGENLTVLEDDSFITIMIRTTLAKENAPNNFYARYWSKVSCVISDPAEAELENISIMNADPYAVVDDGDRWIVTHYYDIDVTANTSGNYSIVANYSAYLDGAWTWTETSTTYFSYDWGGEGGEEEGPPTGAGSWEWLSGGGLMDMFGVIGFFGMIGCPALMVLAVRYGTSRFEALVVLIMAEVLFFALFIAGT